MIVDVNEDRAEKRSHNLKRRCTHAVVHNAPPCKLEVSREEDPIFAQGVSGALRLIYIGALHEIVYLHSAIQALTLIVEGVHFFILGDDRNEYGNYLKSLASQLGCSGRLTFGGMVPRNRLASVLAGADIGLALYGTKAPTAENQILCAPNKVYEYMAAGLPTVCSKNQTLVHLVQENRWGLCVEPEDAEGIACAVNRLTQDETLRQQMSRNARQLHLTSMNFEFQAAPLISALERVKRRFDQEPWFRNPTAKGDLRSMKQN
jgi:glycosyltransferase involved in cell wall biosynthesis